MRIAIAGATGMLGSRVAAGLRSRGRDVRAGPDAVLDGCDVVVDASNDASRDAEERLVEGSRRLLAAEAAAGVGHHVCVAGPEVVDARDLARTWRSITGSRVLLLPVPLPGGMGRAMRAGMLTDRQPDVRGTTRFATWLAATTR